MNNEYEQTTTSGLPFEPITLLIGLLRRWKIFLAMVILSGVLGVVLALQFGTRVYEAETILLYKGPSGKEQKTEEAGLRLPLNTQIQMVKIPANLEAVRERLQLATTLKTLGKACVVRGERKTKLVSIEARWNSAKVAREIARTLRDVFLTNQMKLAKSNAKKELRMAEARCDKVENEVKRADKKLQDFISDNKVVDLGKETQWNLQQLSSLEMLLSNSRNEKDTIEVQKLSVQQKIDTLKEKVAGEESLAARNQSLADLNIRIERLRRAIHDDKMQRQGVVDLEKFKTVYDRAKELYAKGLISKQEFEQSKASYESQEVKAVDTEQITEWKRQLKVLEKEVIPTKPDFKTPSQELLQSLQVRVLDMDLNELSLRKKVGHLSHEVDRIKSRLDKLGDLQRQHAALSREVNAAEGRKSEAEQIVSAARRSYEAADSGFVIVSDAELPLFSAKSNRKIIAAVALFLGTMVAFTLILALELLDRRIKSGAELQYKFSKPVIGLVPKHNASQVLFPGASAFPLIELFRIISRRVRRECPEKGVKIMITSAGEQEGKTLVASNLAACLSRLDEQVLVIDGNLRSSSAKTDLRYMIDPKARTGKGLGEWLASGEKDFDEIVRPTIFSGVRCIPRSESPVSPDLLGARRMGDLMGDLGERFSLILVDGPAVSDRVDAELAVQWCDAVIFVVRSRASQASAVKRAFESISDSNVPLVGFILNDVDRIYLKWG